jgi:hypothetical protein
VPRYSFTISQGGQPQPSNAFDCKDDGAAKKEASGTFADMSRDISKRLQLDDPDWQIEVADEAGKSIFTIRVTAESKASSCRRLLLSYHLSLHYRRQRPYSRPWGRQWLSCSLRDHRRLSFHLRCFRPLEQRRDN